MSLHADLFRIPDPVFAEWSYYNIDYAMLASLPLDTLCRGCTAALQCPLCDDIVLACQKELEKVSSFLHMKGSEIEHSIQACEHHIQSMSLQSPDEQLIHLGQIEETIGAAMGQVLALARFRRSNFTGLWRQLSRVESHCTHHFGELVESLATSPLFGESSLETHQMFRVSQVFSSIQSCYSAGGVSAGRPSVFPALALWRGWIDPARVRKVLKLLRKRLAETCADAHAPAHSSPTHASLPPSSTFAGPSRSKHLQCALPPPSPPNTFHSSTHVSPASSASQLHASNAPNAGNNVYTLHLDNPALSRYHASLSAESSTCSSFSLSWADGDSAVRMSHSTLQGPWLADHRRLSEITLLHHQLLPFLQNDLNLNKLALSQSLPHLPLSPESDSDHRVRQRDMQRSAQKIQKRLILESLQPLVITNEDRYEFADPHVPGFRVVVRTNVLFAYNDRMTEYTPDAASKTWLQNVLYNGLGTDRASMKQLPFSLIEIHLGSEQNQMPGWLAHLFFDTTSVHPVLDFDLYVHAIATLRMDRVAEIPYWVVDCCRYPFALSDSSPCSSPTTRVSQISASRAAAHSPIDIPASPATAQLAGESTPLLPISISATTQHPQNFRYHLSALLATATVLSLVVCVWPHHQQIARIVVEIINLIAEWVGRILQLV
ncbi:Phosphate metabolism transcription protein [Coemansia sp. RSA 2336]|nr:Phosphate metabolism transcription protein [Coemansia sp. RSA 2336]